MRFNYPYKAYIIGFLVFLFVCLYGITMLLQIYEQNHSNLMMLLCSILYALLIFHFGRYYIERIRIYMDRFLKIDKHSLVYHNHEIDDTIEAENIDVIFLARHLQNLKIHRVIHIFKSDGTYYFITSDINRFERLAKVLHETFPDKYYATRKLIKGFHEITKGFLFYYL